MSTTYGCWRRAMTTGPGRCVAWNSISTVRYYIIVAAVFICADLHNPVYLTQLLNTLNVFICKCCIM